MDDFSKVDLIYRWDQVSQPQLAKNGTVGSRLSKSLMGTNVTGGLSKLYKKYLGLTSVADPDPHFCPPDPDPAT